MRRREQLREQVTERAMPRRGLVEGPDLKYFQRRFFTPSEVAQHNQLEDLWVSYLGSVYNLTPLARAYEGEEQARPGRVCIWECSLTAAASPQETRC